MIAFWANISTMDKLAIFMKIGDKASVQAIA
jgi:hypothetical protein